MIPFLVVFVIIPLLTFVSLLTIRFLRHDNKFLHLYINAFLKFTKRAIKLFVEFNRNFLCNRSCSLSFSHFDFLSRSDNVYTQFITGLYTHCYHYLTKELTRYHIELIFKQKFIAFCSHRYQKLAEKQLTPLYYLIN